MLISAIGDKRRAVEKLLRDPEWNKWQVTRIAKWCGVTQGYVSQLCEVSISVMETSHKPEPTRQQPQTVAPIASAPSAERHIYRDTGEIFGAGLCEDLLTVNNSSHKRLT